jgi:hypothetical protein
MIQRYNIYCGTEELTQVVPASDGTWVRYTDFAWYWRQVAMSLAINALGWFIVLIILFTL